MNYIGLANFIEQRMRMSHIYQPVMLLALLKNNGKCSVNDIAREISRYDQSQNEYYKKITNNMVGRVLRNHNIVAKDRSSYYFLDYKSLSTDEISALIKLCIRKLDEYLDKRGNKIRTHRRKTTGYIAVQLSTKFSKEQNSIVSFVVFPQMKELSRWITLNSGIKVAVMVFLIFKHCVTSVMR